MAPAEEGGGDLYSLADLITPMVLRTAATLRIADHIARGVRTAPELAETAGTDPDALARLLRHLAATGVLDHDDQERYTLTPLGEQLREDHPSGMRMILDVTSALGRAELSLVHLPHSVDTGEPAFPLQFGRTFWEDLAADPARSASFDAFMGVDAAADAPAVLSAYDWGALGHVVDVGGGDGTLLIAMLEEHPALRGTVLELPNTAAAARRALADAGLDQRATAVSGSFLDPLPPGAGGYVLSAILHNWDGDTARAILRRCAEAAGAAGRVFVVERTGAAGAALHTGMDLRMLAYFGGKERDAAEITALAADAGLTTVAVHPAGELSIVELATA